MSGRTSQVALARLREELSGRDLAILQSIADARLMSGGQLQALFFDATEHASFATAARTARRVLARLTRERLLVRLERRVGGVRAGSASFVYGLGPVGQRLLAPDDTRRRFREPTETFVRHTVAVAQVTVDINRRVRRGDVEVLRIEQEPRCWRRIGTGAGSALLRPDLFLALANTDFELRWFVEVDLATESLPTLLRKCALYESYYRSGVEQAAGESVPRVVWNVPTTARRTKLQRGIAAAATLTTELFIVVTEDELLNTLAGEAPS